MNTAFALLVLVALEPTEGVVIKDETNTYDQNKRRSSVAMDRSSDCPQLDGNVDGSRFASEKAAKLSLLHRDSSLRTKGGGNSKGGSSESHQESGKRGEDLKETVKKEYGAHKGVTGGHASGTRAEGNSEKASENKHHGHYKAGANKRNKKISKGFHEEYRKDEKKSKNGHWEHEHTEGRFIKFGKKRGQKGLQKANQSDEKQAKNANEDVAKDFKGLDQLVSVVWSNKKKPIYHRWN